jgi:flagellar P-ring protein precursor FlgI
MLRNPTLRTLALAAGLALVALLGARPAAAEKIRDVVRLKNEVPNELVGMGLVVGLKGTGDGGDFMPTMRPLKEMMKRFDNPVALEKELKNANNVAIVALSCKVPPQGAHSGEPLDVKVSALAAKSLKGGRLFMVPLFAPRTDVKVVLASASGDLVLPDESNPTEATIRGGGVLIEDVLPDELHNNQFTLVLAPNAASPEKATTIADQINEEVSPQTGGKPVAVAVDSTSVIVTIPPAEQANPTPFIARIMGERLPTLPEPATVRIDTHNQSIILTDEVELDPTVIIHKGITITIGDGLPPAPGAPPADPLHPRTAKLRELVNAFDLLKVSPADRVQIVQKLHEANVLKAKLIVD